MAEVFSDKVTGDFAQALDAFAERVKAAGRVGAQAMAQVVYDDARELVPVKEGVLRDSIYQVFSDDNSSDAKKTYHVSWNRKKAPHGHLIEFGSSRSAASPFLYPAFAMNKPRLVDVANAAMRASLQGAA